MSLWPKPLTVFVYLALFLYVFAVRTSKKVSADRGVASIVEFARQQGAIADFISVQSFNHGGHQVRGLAAIKDLPENTTIISVPANGQLGRTTQIISEFFGPWAPGDEETSGWRLVCALAVERALGKRSVWYPYIKHLPSYGDFQQGQLLWARSELLHHFSTLAVTNKVSQLRTWLEADIAAWSHWMNITSLDWRNGTDESAHVRAMRLAASQVSQEDIEWAFGVLTTRAFQKPGVGPILVPLVDDINTDVTSKCNAKWLDGGEKFEVRTTRRVLAGEELIMKYATKEDNSRYAAEWGFLLTGVPSQSTDSGRSTLLCNNISSLPCMPPSSETQPQIWCLLENLARQSCQTEQAKLAPSSK